MRPARFLYMGLTLVVLFASVYLFLAGEFSASWAVLVIGTIMPFLPIPRRTT